MRFNHEQDAYMFVWSVKGVDRWYAYKEIWYDRVSKMPRLVRLEHSPPAASAVRNKAQPRSRAALSTFATFLQLFGRFNRRLVARPASIGVYSCCPRKSAACHT